MSLRCWDEGKGRTDHRLICAQPYEYLAGHPIDLLYCS